MAMHILAPDEPVPQAIVLPLIVATLRDERDYSTDVVLSDNGIWKVTDKTLFELRQHGDKAAAVAVDLGMARYTGKRYPHLHP